MAGYVSELAFPDHHREPAAVSTITRRLAAIGQIHSQARRPNPGSDALVRETMRGVRRALGVAPRHQKQGVTTEEVAAAVDQLDDRLIDERDRAILLVGYAGGMRRAELAGLDVAAAPEGLLVHLRRSKTDPEARGRRVEIVYGANPSTCPVRAYRAWLRAARFAEGAAFRRVDRHGRVLGRLSSQGVAIVVKRHMGRLGHPASEFASHSLRRGHAITAARNGASERTIMGTTGHTSVQTSAATSTTANSSATPPPRTSAL